MATSLGPTAEDLTDKTNHETSCEGLESVAADVRRLVPDIQIADTITQLAACARTECHQAPHRCLHDLAGFSIFPVPGQPV